MKLTIIVTAGMTVVGLILWGILLVQMFVH